MEKKKVVKLSDVFSVFEPSIILLLSKFFMISGTIGLYFKRDSNKVLFSFLDKLSRLKVNVNISQTYQNKRFILII